MSAKDHVLAVPELCRLIVEQATPSDFPNGISHSCRVDLLNIALSSRCFLEPALDAAWKFVPSLTSLLVLFPRDLWTVRKHNCTGTVLPLTVTREWGEFVSSLLHHWTGFNRLL